MNEQRKENERIKQPEPELNAPEQKIEQEQAVDEGAVVVDTQSATEEPAADLTAELNSKIKDLGDELVIAKDKLIRLSAEFDNFRKRMIKEKNDIRINTQFDAVSAIIPVLDHFELALTSAEQSKNLDVLIEGMELIKTEFEKALSTLGVEYIHAVGSKFNPMFHEAVSTEQSDEHEKEIVIKQWRTGYKLGERVIRPATVVVSDGKPEAN